MKRKNSVVSSIFILLVLVLVVIPIMACTKTTPSGVKTLKIGAILPFEFPLGMMAKKQLDVVVPEYNKKGGLVINGERYNIDVITYDNKNSPETARSAIEKLVFEDKVKFILGDETWDAWVPVTEAEKVLVVGVSPSPEIFSTKYNYIFQASWLNTQAPTVWGWFTKANPDLKSIAAIYPDSQLGKAEAMMVERISKVFGLKLIDTIFYPPGTSDFAAVATKVKTANADIFTTGGGGPVEGPALLKALYQTGYKGKLVSHNVVSPGSMEKVIPMNVVEGMITAMSGTEMEPMPPISKELVDAYTAKYGAWDYPIILNILTWYCMTTALEKAQSIDPDKVAAVISKGMTFESPHAQGTMISRPDFKNPKTVDALFSVHVGVIENGKTKLIHTISSQDALQYSKTAYGW